MTTASPTSAEPPKSGPLKLFAVEPSPDGAGDGVVDDAREGARRLKAAREAKGLSVEEAAAAVRLQPSFVSALETLDFTTLPSAAYAAPFVRTYASFLGMDGARFAAVFGEAAREGRAEDDFVAPPVGLEARPSRSLYAGLGVVLVLAAALGWVFLAPKPEDESAAPSTLIAAPAESATDARSGFADRSDASSGRTDLAARGGRIRSAPADAPDGRVLGPGDPERDPYLKAVRAAWLRVEAPDGAVLFQGDLEIGDRYAAPAGAGYLASVRDAGAFDYFRDGVFVEALGADEAALISFSFE